MYERHHLLQLKQSQIYKKFIINHLGKSLGLGNGNIPW